MATTIDQKNYVKTALRLPPEVHAAVHASAQKNGRSYNAELVALIERGLVTPDGFIPAPKSVMSVAEDGGYQVRTGQELVVELADKLREASHLAEIFRSFQFPQEPVDLDNVPDWVGAPMTDPKP